MSGSLNLALNSSGEPTPLNINALGELIVTTGGGGGTTNVDVVGNTIGLATEATVATLATQATLANLDSKVTAVDTGAVVVSSSALPSGASTSALQTTGNTSLATIAGDTTSLDGKITQGYDATIASGGAGLSQQLMYGRDGSGNLDALLVNPSGSLQVVATEDDATNTLDSLAPTAGSTATTTAVDLNGTNGNVTCFGNTSNTTDPIELEFSADNVTYYRSGDVFINVLPSGDYGFQISNVGARYIRLAQTDTVTSAWTWSSNVSRR